MIGFVSGILAHKAAPLLMVDVGGVGYEIQASLTTFADLHAAGESVKLLTHFVVREDAQLLFGFSSEENLNLFLANPAKYAPQYGGYCAWAVAQGQTAKGDARRWAVVDGKLYLNYNKGIQKRWNKDRAGFIASGDENWPTVLQD